RPDGGPGRFAFVNGAPDVEDGHERDEPEHGSRQKIEPVGQIILDPDVEDVPVLFHRPLTRGSGARSGSINWVLMCSRWCHWSAGHPAVSNFLTNASSSMPAKCISIDIGCRAAEAGRRIAACCRVSVVV